MLWAISDLHLGDRKRGDNFTGEYHLRTFLESIPDKSLVLLGDVFDLTEAKLLSVELAYNELIQLLFQKALYYVVGNHDLSMVGLMYYMGVPVVEKLILGSTVFMHGHQLDILNEDGNSIGPVVTRAVHWMEHHVSSRIGKQASKLEMWLRNQGKFGRPQDYRRKALRYVESFYVNSDCINMIVLGHTHVKDSCRGYMNTGAWVYRKMDTTLIWP